MNRLRFPSFNIPLLVLKPRECRAMPHRRRERPMRTSREQFDRLLRCFVELEQRIAGFLESHVK